MTNKEKKSKGEIKMVRLSHQEKERRELLFKDSVRFPNIRTMGTQKLYSKQRSRKTHLFTHAEVQRYFAEFIKNFNEGFQKIPRKNMPVELRNQRFDSIFQENSEQVLRFPLAVEIKPENIEIGEFQRGLGQTLLMLRFQVEPCYVLPTKYRSLIAKIKDYMPWLTIFIYSEHAKFGLIQRSNRSNTDRENQRKFNV